MGTLELIAVENPSCTVDLRSHPVHQLPDAAKAASVAIMVHGDEGQGKRNKNVLVVSWSAMGIGNKTYQCRFPFAVARRDDHAIWGNVFFF